MRVAMVLQNYKSALEAQSQFMLSLPSRDLFGAAVNSKSLNGKSDGKISSHNERGPWVEAEALKEATIKVAELQVEIHSELRFAKREFSWAKLGARDFSKISKLLRGILIPVSGMESLVNVASLIEKRRDLNAAQPYETTPQLTTSNSDASERIEKEQWDWIFKQLQGPVHALLMVMIEGLDHALYTLEFAKRPHSAVKSDIEAKDPHQPGERGFVDRLESAIQEFLQQREGPLKEWCTSKGMDLPPSGQIPNSSTDTLRERHQTQLFLLLNVSFNPLSFAIR
jgi:Putative ER transporter, 6TM, N-terminal